MKATVKTYLILLILALANGSMMSQALEEMPCSLENHTFINQEKLVYKVYYNWQFIWIPAGEVSFQVSEFEDRYEVECLGKTYASYDAFFKVRDRYFSVIDKATLLPKYFLRDIKEGNYIRYDSIVFNQDDRSIKEYIGKTKEEIKLLEFTSEHCVHDMVSILYSLRNLNDKHLEKGYDIPINVFFDKEFFNLDIKVKDRGSKRIKGMGKYDVIHISPELVTGDVFKEGNEMNIFVADDGSKIPLLIESAVSVGSVKALLIDQQNVPLVNY